MNTDKPILPDKSLFWTPPSPDTITAEIDRAQANQPDTVMITLCLKLRTTWFKQDALKRAQQRITSMKAEVLNLFRQDLEQIRTGQTRQRLVNTLVEIVTLDLELGTTSQGTREDLRQELLQICGNESDVRMVKGIIRAIATADASSSQGIGLLRQYLQRWYNKHPDRNLEKTLKAAAEAKKRNTKQSREDKSTSSKPRYSVEELEEIKFALLLRKALNHAHGTQMEAKRIVMLTDLAERHAHERESVQRINKAIMQHCTGQVNDRLIESICTIVLRQTYVDEPKVDDIAELRDQLYTYYMETHKQYRRIRRLKNPNQSWQGLVPWVPKLIHALAVSTDQERGLEKLRVSLERWYQEHPDEVIEATLVEAAKDWTADELRQLRYALLLRAYFEATFIVSTDVLLIVEFAEGITRQLNDGTELLSGMLSRCYNETCSQFKYPLSSVLRESVFLECAMMILAWSQLVVDYKAERDKKRPNNQPPRRQKGESSTYCKLNLFLGKRVTRIGLLYNIWRIEDEAYRLAAAQVVPIGPDAGKTLGNLDPYRPHRRKRGRKVTVRRRTTILGPGIIGKKGGRRLRTWLVPYDIAATTLKSVEILLYPELHSDDEIRAARSTPHPWWRGKKRRRGVARTRPTQYRDNSQKRITYLWELSRPDLQNLRRQLREQLAHSAAFETIRQYIDRFLDQAPPTYPQVDHPLFTANEISQLPFEAHLPFSHSYEGRLDVYFKALDWFYDFRPSRNTDEEEDDFIEKLYDVETLAARELEHAAANLQASDLQPIWFKRTMGVYAYPKAFTLLFYERKHKEKTGYRYIFACDLIGETAHERDVLTQRERNNLPETQYFINFPQHKFLSAQDSSLIFFPTEIGEDYQGAILRDLIERQRGVAVKCKSDCPAEQTGEHLATCAPEAVISTATIVAEHHSLSRISWYAHLPVPQFVRACTTRPNAIMGLHEHQGQFFFAVIDFDGTVIDLGEISIPDHVGPKTRKGQTSDNFAFEVAWAIIKQSRTTNYIAYIGIEDTAWQREQISISADENRGRFAFPRERIIEIVQYKAATEGLLMPIRVRRVAPTRDCGYCGHRAEVGSAIRLYAVKHCFYCWAFGIRHGLVSEVTMAGEVVQRCTTCSRTWEVKEPKYTCLRCRWEQHARYNAAIVAARRMLDQLGNQASLQDVQSDEVGEEE